GWSSCPSMPCLRKLVTDLLLEKLMLEEAQVSRSNVSGTSIVQSDGWKTGTPPPIRRPDSGSRLYRDRGDRVLSRMAPSRCKAAWPGVCAEALAPRVRPRGPQKASAAHFQCSPTPWVPMPSNGPQGRKAASESARESLRHRL